MYDLVRQADVLIQNFRATPRDQPAAHLLRHHRLRVARPLSQPGGARPGPPGL
jgi:hypothetical protein